MRWCLNCDLRMWREELAFWWGRRQAGNARLMSSIVSGLAKIQVMVDMGQGADMARK